MAQVEFPRRYTVGNTIANVTNTNRFFIALEDKQYFKPGDFVEAHASRSGAFTLYLDNNGSQGAAVDLDTLYLQQGEHDSETEFYFTTDEAGKNKIWRVPIHFHVSKPAGIVTSYPMLPKLEYPNAQRLESVYHPHHQRNYTVSRPVFKGSIEIDCQFEADAYIIQAFIDQLADPDAWFECPLPGSHLGSASVEAYTSSTEIIQIPGSLERQYNHLRGWYARVGNKTCHIYADDTVPLLKSNVEWVNDGFEADERLGVTQATYNALSDRDSLVFTSIRRIDGTPPQDGGPRVGETYYVQKLTGPHHEQSELRTIRLYPNQNLTGTTIKFSENEEPVDEAGYHENQFIVGGPYEKHEIKIVPSYLIDGTFAQNNKNNFSATETIRVRPTNISASGAVGFGNNPFIIEWTETDGAT